MKVLIQRWSDGSFVKAHAVWVSQKAEAQDFRNCTEAINYCVQKGLTEVRLCLNFGDTRYDLVLEVFQKKKPKLLKGSNQRRSTKQGLLRRSNSISGESQDRNEQFGFRRKAAPSTEKNDRQSPDA